MPPKQNDFLIRNISRALVCKDLEVSETLCVKAIQLYLDCSEWNLLLKSITLYGKTLRFKSIYSRNKTFLNVAFKQFNRGFEYSNKVTDLDLLVDLSLEFAIAYIYDNQYSEAQQLLQDLDCMKYSGTLKVKCLNTQCLLKAHQFKFNEALKFANQALSIAKQLNEKEALITSLKSVGMVYSRQHNFSKIPEVYNQVFALSNETGDVEGKIISYNNLAVYNASISNFKPALDDFQNSLELANSIGFILHSARCLVNIGAIFSELDNLELAKLHFERVLKEYVHVIDINTKTVLLINLGIIYFKQNNLEEANYKFQLCLDYAIQENYQQFVCLSYHHLGKIELKRGNIDKANQFALKANELFERLGGEINGKEENLIVLAKCNQLNGDSKTATTLAIQGLELAEKLENYSCIASSSAILSEIYSTAKQFEKAFHYQQLVLKGHKKQYEEKKVRALLDLEIQYNTRENERKIEVLKSTNNIQAQLLDKQKAFEQQNKLLLQANEELKQFTYAVSHDLREPVRMIESYIQLIKIKYSDTWNDEQHEFFDYVSDGAMRMRILLKDLLEYATLSGNGLRDKSEFSLESIIHSVELDLSIKIQESNSIILLKNDARLFTNKTLFRLVIQNLVSNAIKFRKADKDPIIAIDAQTQGEKTIISVADNGIGIEENYQHKVFQLFHRIHAKEKYEGTGIGLALCSKILRMMEGDISLTSSPGEGTTFILEFPQSTSVQNELAKLSDIHNING